jgi:hypothetical protein
MALPLDIEQYSTLISSAQPDSEKQKGTAKLGKILTGMGIELAQSSLPLILTYAQQLNIDPNGENLPDVCPSTDIINNILPPLNNIITKLNTTSETFNKIQKYLTLLNAGVVTSLNIAKTINTTLPILQAAIQAIPIPPGALVGADSILTYIKENILLGEDGTPRLPPIAAGVGSAGIGITLFISVLNSIITVIKKIISLIQICLPQASINTLSDTINNITNSTNQTNNPTQTLYQGFIINIEEKDYSPTVKQRRAVGQNYQGITLITTPYSFTTNPQTLINELKFIIDRDKLKAY